MALPQAQGLYNPANEHDACGVGFVAHIKGAKSHAIVEQGLQILINLDHRGATGADELFGDGAGILIQIPDDLYREEMARQGVTLPPQGEYGVGMVFLPKEHASRIACEQELERTVRAEGQRVIGWRDVPVDHAMEMSPLVRESEPVIRQIFIGRGRDVMVPDALERKLYIIRKAASHAIRNLGLKHGKEYFVPSMSTRTVVYRACCSPVRSAVTSRTCRMRAASRRWPWCISASRPTPSRPGSLLTPTACWPTTARSTPSRATTTGCAPARA